MSTASGDLITVFGGSGFVGRYAVRALCAAGWRVRVAVRNPMNAGDMRLSGEVGQVQIVQANVRNRPSVARAVEGADAVLNLVGILYEKGRQSFTGAQALGASNVAEISSAAGVRRLVQISAIGADAESGSEYARTKAEGEAAVRRHFPNATILRPSIIFGEEDEFLNRFAGMAKISPVLPLIGGGKTKFQPVFVGDVAAAIVNALALPEAVGRTFELGGPRTYTFRDILEYVAAEIDRPRFLLPLPFFLAEIIGVVTRGLFTLWPFHAPPITDDQVKLLKHDNIVGLSATDASGLPVGNFADLGMTDLEMMEQIAPNYLWPYRPHGQFQLRTPTDDVSRADL